THESYHQKRIREEGQRRRRREQVVTPKQSRGRDDKEDGCENSDNTNPRSELLGNARQHKGGAPQGDSGDERRHAGREARRSAREEEAFADRKDEEARSDTIIA